LRARGQVLACGVARLASMIGGGRLGLTDGAERTMVWVWVNKTVRSTPYPRGAWIDFGERSERLPVLGG